MQSFKEFPLKTKYELRVQTVVMNVQTKTRINGKIHQYATVYTTNYVLKNRILPALVKLEPLKFQRTVDISAIKNATITDQKNSKVHVSLISLRKYIIFYRHRINNTCKYKYHTQQ